MVRIRPGIYQLKIPIPNDPMVCTNAYLIQGDGEYMLIDPGMNTEEAWQALQKELADIGATFDQITQVIATHAHGDHYGLCGRVKQVAPHAKIILHHVDADSIQSQFSTSMEERMKMTEQMLCLNGAPKSDPAESLAAFSRMPRYAVTTSPDVILEGGENLEIGDFNLKIYWTPGHSPGHVCLYESEQKILFSGDHVLPVITPNVSIRIQSNVVNPLGDFFNSLEVVEQLDVSLVLPAHEQVFTDLQGRVEQIRVHHKNRNKEIMSTMKDGSKTAYQVSSEITWRPEQGGVRFFDLALMDRRMALTETLAHLESMRLDEKVDKFVKDDIVYYERI